MARPLPQFSFKRYIATRVYNVESPHHLRAIIEDEVERVSTGSTGGLVRVLSIALFAGAEHYECRVWLLKPRAKVACNIDESFDPGQVYRAVVEEFEATRIMAEFDFEAAARAGFPVAEAAPGRELALKLAELLRLPQLPHAAAAPAAEAAGGEAVAARQREARPPRREATAATAAPRLPGGAGEWLHICLRKIRASCADGECSRVADPAEALDRYGVYFNGSGAEYVCALRVEGGPECRYVLVILSRDDLRHSCHRSIEDLKRAIEEARRAIRGDYTAASNE